MIRDAAPDTEESTTALLFKQKNCPATVQTQLTTPVERAPSLYANSSRVFFHVASFQLHRRIPLARTARPAAFTNLSRLITR